VRILSRVGGGGYGGIEAEGDVGGAQIVIDGLGNRNDLHALVKEFGRNLLRAVVATDGDDRVNSRFLRVGDDLVGNVADDFLAVLHRLVLKGITAVGGAEDGAAAGQDTAHALARQFKRALGPDQAVKAIGDANDLPVVFENGRLDDGANDHVESASPPPVPMPMQRMSDTLTRLIAGLEV
jgi:hypothetical protein